MKRFAILTAATIAAALAFQAGAGSFYRCDIEGTPSFSDRPCSESAELIEVKAQPSALTDSEAAEINRRMLVEAAAMVDRRLAVQQKEAIRAQAAMTANAKARVRAKAQARAEARHERAVRALEYTARWSR